MSVTSLTFGQRGRGLGHEQPVSDVHWQLLQSMHEELPPHNNCAVGRAKQIHWHCVRTQVPTVQQSNSRRWQHKQWCVAPLAQSRGERSVQHRQMKENVLRYSAGLHEKWRLCGVINEWKGTERSDWEVTLKELKGKGFGHDWLKRKAGLNEDLKLCWWHLPSQSDCFLLSL